MPLMPNKNSKEGRKLYDLYLNLEYELLEDITADLKEQRMSNIDSINKMDGKINKASERRKRLVKSIITASFLYGANTFYEDLKGRRVIDSALIKDKQAINYSSNIGIVESTNYYFDLLDSNIKNQTKKIYNSVIRETVLSGAIHNETYRQSVQRALNMFADKGIVSFVDKAQRRWEMATYSEMAIRTAIMNTTLESYKNLALENNQDLIIVSSHGGSCPLCTPWEGNVLSLSGRNSNYPSLSEAKDSGLFHPNCRHVFFLYYKGGSGVTEDNLHKDTGLYEKTQKQRYMERMVRKWKRRSIVSLDKNNENYSNNKVRYWQKEIREFVRENNLKRYYDREKIYKKG